MIGRLVAKLVARLLATAALLVRSKHISKIQKGRRKQRRGQHTLAPQPPQKMIMFNYFLLLKTFSIDCAV